MLDPSVSGPIAAGAAIALTIRRYLRNSGGSISIGMCWCIGVFGITTVSPSPPWLVRAEEKTSSSRAASKTGS